MNSLRSQLPDADALLLMYAAGELPPEDQQAVEAELARDAALSDRLAALRADLALSEQALQSADDVNGLRADSATRRAIDAIRNWQLVRPAAPADKPLAVPSRRWGWGSAAAAVVAIGLGAALLASYLNPPSRRATHSFDGLPELDSSETPLALNAANSLAVGLHVDDDAIPESPMPPDIDEPIVSVDQPFFDVPLIADADD